ncbi:MAG: CsbD family protein [Chloroflexi bacterium]|nr:CsbD family protein [Chloroflexota bacterium]MBI3168986.1 CsbD family protein [Chloroflexota bacterium]
MNVTFNRDVLAGQWKQVRGKAKQTWGKLTDNDLDRISGRFEELAGLIQQRYGYTKEKAEQEVEHFIEKIHMK